MGAWDTYQARLDIRGESLRGVRARRESTYLNRKIPNTLSYFTAEVDGENRQVAIVNSDNLNQKTIISLPGETLLCGSYVHWEDNYWLITEIDANQEIYTKGIMLQCNYLLRWIDSGRIIERWSIITDGTKYLTGETISSYNDNGMSLGDSRIAMTVPRDKYTLRLTRANRFLIDDYDSVNVLAYRLTKPFKLGATYNKHGIFNFVLTEVNTEDDDNFKLHIADYYKYFPRESDEIPVIPGETTTETGKKVWL